MSLNTLQIAMLYPFLCIPQVHAYIIAALRKDFPTMFGKDAKKKELIKNLGQIYDQIQREYQISPGDFPDIKKMQVCLRDT